MIVRFHPNSNPMTLHKRFLLLQLTALQSIAGKNTPTTAAHRFLEASGGI